MTRRRLCVAGAIAAWSWFASSAGVAQAAQQVITFTTSPPIHAVVGGSYTVSATETSGGQVYVTATGACSLRTAAEVRKAPTLKQPLAPRLVPVVVHFIEAGSCVIDATGTGEYEEEVPKASQSFAIEAGAGGVEQPANGELVKKQQRSQTIWFTSRPPVTATVDGAKYRLAAKASSGLRVALASKTPRVCRIVGGAVHFVRQGQCMLEATQRGDADYRAARPAHQSFAVRRR